MKAFVVLFFSSNVERTFLSATLVSNDNSFRHVFLSGRDFLDSLPCTEQTRDSSLLAVWNKIRRFLAPATLAFLGHAASASRAAFLGHIAVIYIAVFVTGKTSPHRTQYPFEQNTALFQNQRRRRSKWFSRFGHASLSMAITDNHPVLAKK